MRVTGREVAEAAGVSRPTVSRALRGDPRISATTTLRVVEAARSLGYAGARAPVVTAEAGRRVAVVVGELSNPFYSQLLQPLHEELQSRGHRTIVLAEGADGPLRAGDLLAQSIDAVVLTTTGSGSVLVAGLRAHGIPVVLVNRDLQGTAADTCVADNVEGGRLVATEFARNGHTCVAAVLGPPSTSTSRERETGVRSGLAVAGIDLPDRLVHRVPYDAEAGCRAVLDLLDSPVPPTAVFCGNDVLAFGALNGAAEAGVDVPGDLSVVGFDDVEMSSWATVRLTTVRCDGALMARTAATLVADRLQGRAGAPRHVVLPVELVHRGSSGPAPG